MKSKKEDKDAGALFIPAGLLTGIGIGFVINNIPAATLIGLGSGFLLFAIFSLFNKKR